MIRFVDLTGQIDDGPAFAFWDTVPDRFVKVWGQVWETWAEFEEDARQPLQPRNNPYVTEEERGRIEHLIERCRAVFPKHWPAVAPEDLEFPAGESYRLALRNVGRSEVWLRVENSDSRGTVTLDEDDARTLRNWLSAWLASRT